MIKTEEREEESRYSRGLSDLKDLKKWLLSSTRSVLKTLVSETIEFMEDPHCE